MEAVCVVSSGSVNRLNGSAAALQENKSVWDWHQHLTECSIDILFIRILRNSVQMKYGMYVMLHKHRLYCNVEYRAYTKWKGSSDDQANVGLIFVVFQCTLYAHIINLCGLYPWTTHIAMYNTRVSVILLLQSKEELKALCTQAKKLHFLMSAWHGGTSLKVIIGGKTIDPKDAQNIKHVPSTLQQTMHKKKDVSSVILEKDEYLWPCSWQWNWIKGWKKWTQRSTSVLYLLSPVMTFLFSPQLDLIRS